MEGENKAAGVLREHLREYIKGLTDAELDLLMKRYIKDSLIINAEIERRKEIRRK